MAHESSLQNIDDVAAVIQHELSKPSIRDWIGPSCRVNVRKLECAHDWRSHLPSLGVKLEGGLLVDQSGNHLFLSMQRRGIKGFKWFHNGFQLDIWVWFSPKKR